MDTERMPSEEELKIENDFIKMKLMLEKGAAFYQEDPSIPLEIENEFLKHVMEFEEQWKDVKQIKVFDKIGRPEHFAAVTEIPDAAIDRAWSDLSGWLMKHGISLGVCSPNIGSRELYRFTIEELFQCEIDDLNMEGAVQCFIYDEFYPDHVYDNSMLATEECIRRILLPQPLEWMQYFAEEGLRLNKHEMLDREGLQLLVNRFKQAYDKLEILELENNFCLIEENSCKVEGTYSVRALIGSGRVELGGNWKVGLEKDIETGFWFVTTVDIEGINF